MACIPSDGSQPHRAEREEHPRRREQMGVRLPRFTMCGKWPVGDGDRAESPGR